MIDHGRREGRQRVAAVVFGVAAAAGCQSEEGTDVVIVGHLDGVAETDKVFIELFVGERTEWVDIGGGRAEVKLDRVYDPEIDLIDFLGGEFDGERSVRFAGGERDEVVVAAVAWSPTPDGFDQERFWFGHTTIDVVAGEGRRYELSLVEHSNSREATQPDVCPPTAVPVGTEATDVFVWGDAVRDGESVGQLGHCLRWRDLDGNLVWSSWMGDRDCDGTSFTRDDNGCRQSVDRNECNEDDPETHLTDPPLDEDGDGYSEVESSVDLGVIIIPGGGCEECLRDGHPVRCDCPAAGTEPPFAYDANVHFGADEMCDGIDSNCDGLPMPPTRADGLLVVASPGGGVCPAAGSPAYDFKCQESVITGSIGDIEILPLAIPFAMADHWCFDLLCRGQDHTCTIDHFAMAGMTSFSPPTCTQAVTNIAACADDDATQDSSVAHLLGAEVPVGNCGVRRWGNAPGWSVAIEPHNDMHPEFDAWGPCNTINLTAGSVFPPEAPEAMIALTIDAEASGIRKVVPVLLRTSADGGVTCPTDPFRCAPRAVVVSMVTSP